MIVGIDPSLTGTAVVFRDSTIDRDAWGFKRFPSVNRGDTVRARIDRAEDLVAQVVEYLEHQGPISAIYLEGYSFRSAGRKEATAEYGGLLRWHLLGLSSVVHDVPPATLKKFLTGAGNAKKEIIAAHIVKRWGVMFKTDDEFDAYGLMRFGEVVSGVASPASKSQEEAILAFRKSLEPAAKKPRRKR